MLVFHHPVIIFQNASVCEDCGLYFSLIFVPLLYRHIWDMFLVPEGTQGGSRIPDGWVEPELPTSSVWASVIQANSTTN